MHFRAKPAVALVSIDYPVRDVRGMFLTDGELDELYVCHVKRAAIIGQD
jgi:hypothetical protein